MVHVTTSCGLLVLRVSYGAFMLFGHGLGKLRGYGDMVDKFADPFGLGMKASLILAIFAEFGCSILLMIGLLTRLACIPLAVTMSVALFMIHGNDDWNTKERAAMYLAIYVVLLLTGPGKYSLDHLIKNWKKSAAA